MLFRIKIISNNIPYLQNQRYKTFIFELKNSTKNLRHPQNPGEAIKKLFPQHKHRRNLMKFRFLFLPVLNRFGFDKFVSGIVDVRCDAELGIR